MNRLIEYPWPGNIRELENVVERAMILSPGSTLIVDSLLEPVAPSVTDLTETNASGTKFGSIDHIVRRHMLSVLEECHWRIKGRAARRIVWESSPARCVTA